ncbi:MAG TPA: serine/threonine-protein kinase [Polyangia bacterium]|nr:serine/threonine-protein kinase [Polyangia bacterium]
MGVPPSAQARDQSADADAEPSVTAVGESVLVRATAPEIVRGMVLAGRYQVEASLGKGGSGIVLRAFDRVAQIPVALKILKPELAADPRWIERFSRELRLARQIQHPNVCRVFDIGQADGHWFISMELASSGTLREHIKPREKGRALSERLADLRAVVGGLEAIHDAGIVHRDLKPDNFLRMDDGRLVLSDFGLATNPAEGSVVSILVGTPSYMAPEIVMGDQASFASDVWSLGVVMHEILFGQRPEWAPGTYRRVSLPGSGPLAPEEKALVTVLEECIQAEPAARPANGREARLRVEAALAGHLRSRWVPRHGRARWAWLAVAAATASAAALSTGHLWRRASAISETRASTPAPIKVGGEAADLSKAMRVVASFHEPVQCLSWIVPDRTLQVVVGKPRRALTLDVESGSQAPAALAEATFAVGCPQRSEQGDILYERLDDSGRHEIMLAPAEGGVAKAKSMTFGSDPVWLPSGREFAYTADDAHAAVFSVPVMTTRILPGPVDDGGMLLQKAVAPDGREMALRYIDRAYRRHVVIHELPSLAIRRSMLFEESATNLAFGANDSLLFTSASPRGNILASLDLDAAAATRLGGVPGRNLGMPRRGDRRVAVVSALEEKDVWRYEGGKRTARLTDDGQSHLPDLSARGDLIVTHESLGFTASIRLFPVDGPPRTLTAGPLDWTPHFLPDGSGFLYADGARQVIRKCSLSGACEDVLATVESSIQPVASPDQRYIAYFTILGSERLKVADARGAIRDLGPARPQCAPHWISPTRLWALQGTDQAPTWAQYDVEAGAQTQTVAVDKSAATGADDCPYLPPVPGAADAPSVGTWSSARADIGVLLVQQPVGHQP